MEDTARFPDKWFPWILAVHLGLALAGVVSGLWFGPLLCSFTAIGWVTLGLLLVWLIVALSPLLGLLAIMETRFRPAYAYLAIATPVFFAISISLQQLGVTYCDGP